MKMGNSKPLPPFEKVILPSHWVPPDTYTSCQADIQAFFGYVSSNLSSSHSSAFSVITQYQKTSKRSRDKVSAISDFIA